MHELFSAHLGIYCQFLTCSSWPDQFWSLSPACCYWIDQTLPINSDSWDLRTIITKSDILAVSLDGPKFSSISFRTDSVASKVFRYISWWVFSFFVRVYVDIVSGHTTQGLGESAPLGNGLCQAMVRQPTTISDQSKPWLLKILPVLGCHYTNIDYCSSF